MRDATTAPARLAAKNMLSEHSATQLPRLAPQAAAVDGTRRNQLDAESESPPSRPIRQSRPRSNPGHVLGS